MAISQHKHAYPPALDKTLNPAESGARRSQDELLYPL